MPTSNAIDLSQLPAPNVIAPLSYEAILAEMTSLVQAGVPGVFDGIPAFDIANEADPAVKVLQVAAWCRLLDRARTNDAAKSVMVAYASGSDLDQLGALFQVARLSGETDDAYRTRIVLGPDGFSVAGPESAYKFHALSADADVLDASAISPEPGEVLVSILSKSGNGEASPGLVATVDAALSAKDVRPMTDLVTVQSAEIIEYEVEAEIFTYEGPDSTVVITNAEVAVETYVASVHRLGRNVTRAGIIAALFADGAQNVNLISPAADIDIEDTQVAWCTNIALSHGGVDE